MSYRKSSHRSAPSKSKANKVPLAMTDSASMDSSHKGFLIEANPVNQYVKSLLSKIHITVTLFLSHSNITIISSLLDLSSSFLGMP